MRIGGYRESTERQNRGKRRKVTEDGGLNYQQLVNAIRQHEIVKGLDDKLNNEDIKAVLKAYSDIVFTSCLLNLAVPLPSLGVFRPLKKKGFKGGMKRIPVMENGKKLSKDTVWEMRYLDPKPDYSVIKFDLSPTVTKQFRALTEAQNEELDNE